MKQKTALAGALIHDPKLLMLDEPLTGLDAAVARQVKDLLQQRARSGGTVILTTHILDVAERMADRIGIIQHGRLLAEGTLEELRGRAGGGGATLEDVYLELVGAAASRSGLMFGPGGVLWLLRHEMLLTWRNWPRRPARPRASAGAADRLSTVMAPRCLAVRRLLGGALAVLRARRRPTPIVLGRHRRSCSRCCSRFMLSQALMLITEAIYQRGDLDLLLASPVPPWRIAARAHGARSPSMSALFYLVLLAPCSSGCRSSAAGAGWRFAPSVLALALLATGAGAGAGAR